jgi:hypothetical protein
MTRFKGPVKNRDVSSQSGPRSWFSNLPIGLGENDYIEYANDFLFAKDYNASDWVVTETQAAATQGIAADVLGGALALVNSAADDDVNQLQAAEEWFKTGVGKRAWFECRFKVSDATQSDLFVGFCTTDTTVIAGTTDSLGFRKSDGSTTLQSLSEDNTVETTNTHLTMADDTYVTVGFYWDGISRVFFYSGSGESRTLVNTHTTTIEQTNKLALTLCLQNGDGNARTLTVDYVYVALER